MLKRLQLENFTVFTKAEFVFSPGLNVVIGTNGTGKSHVLKVGYAVLANLVQESHVEIEYDSEKISDNVEGASVNILVHPNSVETKLTKIFRHSISDLIRRDTTKQASIVSYNMIDVMDSTDVSGSLRIEPFESSPKATSKLIRATSKHFSPPVFIPAKEMLTLGWMLQASSQLKLPIDETYLDLLKQLGRLPLQQPEPAAIKAITTLTNLLGGEVEEEGGRYYLTTARQKRMEMNLVAEGLRKFGTLQKLLANGSLTPRSTLFWDEPEANLNPALIQKLAAVLAALAQQGFQIILATHSLFLLKELHIQSAQHQLPVRYFGLNDRPGHGSVVTTADDLEQLPDITSLDAEIDLADRFQAVLDQEDADDN